MFAQVKRAALIVAAGSTIMLGGGGAVRAAGVTLTIWHNTQDTQGVLALYKAYEKASGNTLSFVDIPADGFETATLTKWASGDRPDILEYHPGQADLDHFNPSQTMVDLSNEAFVKQSSIYEIGGRASDGKVYAAITTFPKLGGLLQQEAARRSWLAARNHLRSIKGAMCGAVQSRHHDHARGGLFGMASCGRALALRVDHCEARLCRRRHGPQG